jgi:hypothetical protein
VARRQPARSANLAQRLGITTFEQLMNQGIRETAAILSRVNGRLCVKNFRKGNAAG